MEIQKHKTMREITEIVVGYIGTMVMAYVVNAIYPLLQPIPVPVRAVLVFPVYWSMGIVPILLMHLRKEKFSDCGFEGHHIRKQIAIGICMAICFSAALTLLPHLIGLSDMVSPGSHYTHVWQFAYEFAYCIFGVGLTEEFLFRGYFFEKIRKISSPMTAMLISSVMFGLLHIFVGDLLQVFGAALIGILFCLCKMKIKNCTTLSLAVGHGVYDALITVLEFVFR